MSKNYQLDYYYRNREARVLYAREARAKMTPEQREADRVSRREKWGPTARRNRKGRLADPTERSRENDRKRTALWASTLSNQLRRKVRNGAHNDRKGRNIHLSDEVDSKWIREQFERQQGRCFYSGIPFEIVAAKRHMRRPSLDSKY